MSYEKIDTPRLNTANVCLVNVLAGAVSAKIEPTVSTHTSISSCTINGSSEFTDSITGLTVKILLTNGNLSFDYVYNEPSTGAVTGSSSFTLELSSAGNTEWKSDTATYTVNLVCCLTDISLDHAGNAVQYVSGVEQSIGLSPAYSAVKDICDGSTSTVLFTAAGNAFVGTPDTPGAYIGLVSGPDGEMPFNIAVRDTRLYTDQEYVVAVDDPSTVYADRGNIKIHTVSDNDGSKPFRENPGNGFYLSCSQGSNSTWVASYSDVSNSSSKPNHKYEIECKDKGTDGGETAAKDCMFYILGDCKCGSDKCIHTKGIRKLTDSEWSLKHNNSEIATATAPYNSLYPPSSGWSGATITGEAEIQYDGEAYTYMSSYDSVTYKPVKGKCTRMGIHTLNFYKHKENKSKSFNGWGTYGGPSSTHATTSYITYDTVTKKYVSGICTANIESDNPSILKEAGPITGAALLTHPITGNYMDHALAIDKKGVGSGYGTSSGPYGVAVPDTMLPSYDWVQFYLNRPRTSCIMPYTGGISATIKHEDNARYLAKWWIAESLSRKHHESGTINILKTSELVTGGLTCGYAGGVIKSSRVCRKIGIQSSIELPDVSSSLDNCTHTLDVPDKLFGISGCNLAVNTDVRVINERYDAKSKHAALDFAEYIVFDDILYKLAGPSTVPVDCHNAYGDCVKSGNTPDDKKYKNEQCEIVLAVWNSCNNRPHLDGIAIETIPGTTDPDISREGKTTKRLVRIDDIYELDSDGCIKSLKIKEDPDNKSILSDSLRTVRNTPTSIICYKLIYRNTTVDEPPNIGVTETVIEGDPLHWAISYGEFGKYEILKADIRTVTECDLIVSYDIRVACSDSSSYAIDYNETANILPYTIWCDGDEPCSVASLCSHSQLTEHTAEIKNAFTVDVTTGHIYARQLTGSDAVEHSYHSESPACVCPDGGDDIDDCYDASDASYTDDVNIYGIYASLVDSRVGVSTAYTGSSSCTMSDGGTATFIGSSKFGDTLGPCLYINYSVRNGNYTSSRGMTMDTGWGDISMFHRDDIICYLPHASSGSSLVTSFDYNASYNSSIHTYDNDDDPDVTLQDTVSVKVTNSRFELSPDGFLGLYIPKTGKQEGSSCITYSEVDHGNGKYTEGRMDRSINSRWRITLTKSGEGVESDDNYNDKDDDTVNLPASTSTDAGDNNCPNIDIVCYRYTGDALEASGSGTITAPSGVYYDVFGDASSSSAIRIPGLICGIGAYPFEAPDKDGSRYRSIATSSKAHMVTEFSDSSGICSIPIGIPNIYVDLLGVCNYTYKVPEDRELWCDYDETINWNTGEESRSDSYIGSTSYSNNTLVEYNPITIVSDEPRMIELYNPSTIISLSDRITDDNHFVLDAELLCIRGSKAGTGCVARDPDNPDDQPYEGIPTVEDVYMTVHWTTFPTITEEMANNKDSVGSNVDILLPIIDANDNTIYKSTYRREVRTGIVKYSTILQCAESEFNDVLDTFNYVMDLSCSKSKSESNSSDDDCCWRMDISDTFKHRRYDVIVEDSNDAEKIRGNIKKIMAEALSRSQNTTVLCNIRYHYDEPKKDLNLNKYGTCRTVIARRKK